MKSRLNLKDFDILEEFKGNSCNKIYLVRRKGSTTKIIFKVIKIYNFQSQLREIQAQKNLKHNYIVRLLDYEIQQKNIVLLIEFAEKGDLFEFINTIETIRESKLLRLFYKIVMAVHFIHLNGFIHRDIKPENILIGGDNEPKLADFGSSVSEDIIRNTFCGTYEYMAPEIYMRKKQTAKVDSWALGVLLYEMTHNSTPFKNKDVMQIKNIVQNDEIQFDDQISTKIRNIIRSILKFNARERPTTAQILKFPGLKRFYEEMKPDLLSMYENNDIAKLRKIKSMNNGFKTEKQYRHMQTAANFDKLEEKKFEKKKKTSNELKRFSKDLTKTMLKNTMSLAKDQTNLDKTQNNQKFEKGETSISELPEEDRQGLCMKMKSIQNIKQINKPKDMEHDLYRVSIHNNTIDKERTSYEQITDIINDVPYKNDQKEVLVGSKNFKNQFLTSQYESKVKSYRKKGNSSSKKQKKYNSDKKKNINKQGSNGFKEKSKLYTNEALNNIKFDLQGYGSKDSKKHQNRSITNKIRSLFDKKKLNSKTPNMKSGLHKLNSDSNNALSMFKKQKIMSKSKSKNFASGRNIINSEYSEFQKNKGLSSCSQYNGCLLYTSPSPRDLSTSRMPSSA